MKSIASDALPVLIGVGQAMEQVPASLDHASSYCGLAEQAVRRALADATAGKLVDSIDVVAAVRTFEDSIPGSKRAFNGPGNLPGALTKRVGARPEQLIYGKLGGQTPQQLVNEFAGKIHSGECSTVLLFGVEVIANIRAARRAGIELDWSEPVAGEFEDRGGNEAFKLMTPEAMRHGITSPMQFYGLMETARRSELGLGKDAYAREMGRVFEPFSRVAAKNPYAQFPRALSVEEIISPGPGNPMLASPYTRNMVAKDGVNQAAAVILTSVARAREMGVPEDKWVFLHGGSDTKELDLMERERLGRSCALEQAMSGALRMAGLDAGDVRHFDIYSCFPVVVLNTCDILDIGPQDRRSLTCTGGLPYFGGPGNNYSMHAIASMAESLRDDPGSVGLVLGNGGFMSSFSVGIYSTSPPEAWRPGDERALQNRIDSQHKVMLNPKPDGNGKIESWLVNYVKDSPVNVVIVGRLDQGAERFIAVSPPQEEAVLRAFADGDPLGQSVRVRPAPDGNSFELHQSPS